MYGFFLELSRGGIAQPDGRAWVLLESYHSRFTLMGLFLGNAWSDATTSYMILQDVLTFSMGFDEFAVARVGAGS